MHRVDLLEPVRDPRLDPRPGDVLRQPGGRRSRTVTYADSSVVAYRTSTGGAWTKSAAAWRAWARTALVVEAAPHG